MKGRLQGSLHWSDGYFRHVSSVFSTLTCTKAQGSKQSRTCDTESNVAGRWASRLVFCAGHHNSRSSIDMVAFLR